jgi:NAD(P)-dependent dehydrogenase (short-subunit alcohol dehydrogenase family)
MTPNPDLTGRVAVVTGAARGVGLALALHAADRGMMVALADIDEYMLAAAVEQVREKNIKAIAVHTDILDFAAVNIVSFTLSSARGR